MTARLAVGAVALLLGGCSLAPVYQVPSTPLPAAFKEAEGWAPAVPADGADRGPWWTIFGDADLSALAERVQVSNQNVAAAVAAADQAQAVLREQRAALSPQLGATAQATRTGGGNSGAPRNSLKAGVVGSWDADVWGRLRSATTAAGAAAEASADDLAAATLAAQGDLIDAYLNLRQADAEIALLDATIAGYARAEQIAKNRYDAGVAPRTDWLQAQTQTFNARSSRAGLQQQRAQSEHLIAVLAGLAPADLTLPVAPQWRAVVPAVPPLLPSELLQRRPDIAAAERRVAAANAQIGVARSAWYPSLGLSAQAGPSVTRISELFNLSSAVWSFGIQATQLIFDAGAATARIDEARAAHARTVAQYRQTVLTAFQDVEDQLAALQWLAEQQGYSQQASTAADQVEAQVLNRYRAGQVGYSEVVQAQVTALSTRRALVQLAAARQTAAVDLVRALGGGWQGLAPAGQ